MKKERKRLRLAVETLWRLDQLEHAKGGQGKAAAPISEFSRCKDPTQCDTDITSFVAAD